MKDSQLVTVDDAVALLNEALKLEPKAVSDLFRNTVEFTGEDLANHPTIQVGVMREGEEHEPHAFVYALSFTGLLNGIFGTDIDRVSIEVDDDFYSNPERLIERFNAHHDWPNDIEADGE